MIDIKTAAYRRASFALALGSFLVFCNLYLFQPLLPLLVNEFQASAVQVNWVQAAGTLTLALCLVPWAMFSDRVGRRSIMTMSLFALPIVGVGYLLVSDLLMLTLVRALMGCVLAGFAAVAMAYMAEEFSPRALMLAVGSYIAANSLGGIAGRVLGGLISDVWSWQVAVASMAAVSFLGAGFVYYLLPSQQHFQPRLSESLGERCHVLLQHFESPELWLAMLIGGCNFAMFMNLYSVMGFRLIDPPYSLPVGWVSLIFICYLSGTLSSRLSGVWRQNHRATTGILLGNTISAAGMLMTVFESVPMMVMGLLLVSAGSFFTHSLAYGWVSYKAKTAKASAAALYLVHYYIGGSLGGFFLLSCWQYSGWKAVMAGGMVLYLLIYGLNYRLRDYESNVWV